MTGGWLWGFVIIGGPILLGLALLLFTGRHRRMTQRQVEASEEAARENWGKERSH